MSAIDESTELARATAAEPAAQLGAGARAVGGRLALLWGRHGRVWPLLVVGLVAALISTAFVSGTVVTVQWMETPEFCGGCHTMKPEFQAFQRSEHKSVACAECHIPPGLEGLVRAKLNGTIEVWKELTATYERPIKPAAYNMPRGEENCRECHREAPSGEDRLVVRRHFADDEANTERKVALVVKVADVAGGRERGIHWHVESRVEFLARDEGERQIDYVRVTEPTGEVREFVSKDLLAAAAYAPGALAQVRSAPAGEGQLKRMDCLSCHNRAGHEFLSPAQAVDRALAEGKIDRTLPFVKRRAVELLEAPYPSAQAARAAIAGLESFYREGYPALAEQKAGAVRRATRALEDLYGQVATPEMLATYVSYPSFLGHAETAGCFRCHDGAHVQIESERARPTEQIVPFNCSLCHTFPEMGSEIRGVPLGTPPEDHRTRQWMSNHRSESGGSTDVTRTTCSACHSQSYCANCHTTGIKHTNMLFEHATVLREGEPGSCTSCHQTTGPRPIESPFCARCHQDAAPTPVAPPRRK